MALSPSRFNKDQQISNDPGSNRGNVVVIKGASPDTRKPKIIKFERFGGIEEFKATDSKLVKQTKDSKRLPPSMSRFFKEVPLDDDLRKRVEADIKSLIEDWKSNRGPLESKLSRFNAMAEGITTFTDFPWIGASNLHIPLAETQLNSFHADARRTMLKDKDYWLIEYMGTEEEPFDRAIKMENALNYICKTKIPFSSVSSDLLWIAPRDGLAVAQVQWIEDREKVRQFKPFDDLDEFQAQYPDVESAGVSLEAYSNILEKLTNGEEVVLEVEEDKLNFAGPLISAIELNDFVVSPITVSETRFAKFCGKRFTWRLTDVANAERNGFVRKGSYEKLKAAAKGQGRSDSYTQERDQIEGITRSSDMEEIELFDGRHNFDINNDGIEEKFLCLFHEKSGTVLQYWYYPYNHNHDCHIPIRIKKRPNRLIGRAMTEMLEDINTEVNVIHNQRVNSRTITTVPTFKAKKSLKADGFDPTRSDQSWIPGRTYYMTNPDDLKQFDIRETDFSQSLNEENQLFQVAEYLTGVSQLRSGRESRSDPRAPALKTQTLLQQSNIRIDDYLEEMAGDAAKNEGFNAIGWHILELYKQFGPKEIEFVVSKDAEMTPEDQVTQKIVQVDSIGRSEITTEDMKIRIAKTSITENAEALFQKAYVLYQILQNEPLVGGVPERRRVLVKGLLDSARADQLRRMMNQANETEQMNIQGIMQQQLGQQPPQISKALGE